MDSLKWAYDLTDSVWDWLLSLRDEQHPGMFRFCRTGATFQPSLKTGLGTSSLALKVCYQINSLSRVKDSDLHRWTEYIKSFQREPDGKFAGLFEDEELLKIPDKNAGWFKKDIKTRRAETRQACAALLCAGASPNFPVLCLPNSRPEVLKYLSSLPWVTNPGGAGSHTSHLVFFLKLNADFFGHRIAYEELLPFILEKLDSLQEQETGSWFRGNPSRGEKITAAMKILTPYNLIGKLLPNLKKLYALQARKKGFWFIGNPLREQKITAAMKILTAYNLIGKPPQYVEHLIDFCLDADNDGDACRNVNILYVLYQCSRWTSYRINDTKAFAERKLAVIKNHRKNDGAFSFFPDRAGDNYYGARVSRGYPESDIHGTHLLVWALTLIGELLGFNKELGWKLPIT